MFLFQLLRLLHLLLTCISLGTIPRQEFAQKRRMFWFFPEAFLCFLEKLNLRIRNGDSVLNDSLSISGFMATPYEQLVRERWRHQFIASHFGNISSWNELHGAKKSSIEIQPTPHQRVCGSFTSGSLLKTGGPVTTLRDLRMLGSSWMKITWLIVFFVTM